MNELFLTLLNRSLAAGWLILVLLILRPFLRRVSRTLCCALWGLVAFRLLCPFSIRSVLSLIPSATSIPTDLISSGEGISAGTQVSGDLLASAPPTMEAVAPSAISPAQTVLRIVVVMWLTGMALFAVYAVLSYLRMHLYVRFSARQDGYWVCDRIKAPFVLGVFRPRIYLPLSVNPCDVPYILAHERAHLARRDHWRKPIAYVLLSVFWFQPLMWVAFILLCRDVEFACDERALRALGVDVQSKKAYAEALFRSTNLRTPAIACPLAFGGLQVKQRVFSVVKYRKPAAMRVLAALLVCAVVAICFLTDPKVGADTTLSATEPGNATEQNTEQTPMKPEQQNQQHLSDANGNADSDENAPPFDYEKMDEIFQYLKQSGMKLEDGTTVLVYQNTGVETMVLTYKWIYTKYTSGPASGKSNEEGVFAEEVVGAEISTIEIPAGETVYVYANEKLAALADSKRVALLSCSYGDLSVNLAG